MARIAPGKQISLSCVHESPLVHVFREGTTSSILLWKDHDDVFGKESLNEHSFRITWSSKEVEANLGHDRVLPLMTALFAETKDENNDSCCLVHVPIASALINFCSGGDSDLTSQSQGQRLALCKFPLSPNNAKGMSVEYAGYVCVPLSRKDMHSAWKVGDWNKITNLLELTSTRNQENDEETDVTSNLWRVAAMRQVALTRQLHELEEGDLADFDISDTHIVVFCCPPGQAPHMLSLQCQVKSVDDE